MMVHGYSRAGVQSELQDPHERIFENDFMTAGRSLYRVVAIWKIRFVLSMGIEMPCEKKNKRHGKNADTSSNRRLAGGFRLAHGSKYRKFP